MPRERAARRWPAIMTSGGATLGAILAPKCPLCVLAILSACGVGVGMGTAGALALILRPLAAVIAMAALIVVVVPLVRRARSRSFAAARVRGGCPACDAKG